LVCPEPIQQEYEDNVEIGIVGFGRFGQFAGDILTKEFKVSAYDHQATAQKTNIQLASLEEVAKKEVLLICVPISEMEVACRQLKPHLFPGQLIVDTCSVKEQPLKLMLDLLPPFVEILGCHPLFGPDSGSSGVSGLEVVLCPGRCTRVNKVKAFLEKLSFRVTVTSAMEHDQAMAKTQALFHFLAKAFFQLKIDSKCLSTPGPAHLFQDFNDVLSDSDQLFRDLQRLNRFVSSERKKLIENLVALDKHLSQDP